MNTMIAAFAIWSMGAACVGCAGEQRDGGTKSNKVADQRLAAYTPIRRITYRGACNSAGPITVCVDRVSLSDTATVVETRIKNASPSSCFLGSASGAAVFLENKSGQALGWGSGQLKVRLGPGEERALRFRMEGDLTGEPTLFRVGAIGGTGPGGGPQQISILVQLGS